MYVTIQIDKIILLLSKLLNTFKYKNFKYINCFKGVFKNLTLLSISLLIFKILDILNP